VIPLRAQFYLRPLESPKYLKNSLSGEMTTGVPSPIEASYASSER
jgi:hypothetical protein